MHAGLGTHHTERLLLAIKECSADLVSTAAQHRNSRLWHIAAGWQLQNRAAAELEWLEQQLVGQLQTAYKAEKRCITSAENAGGP
jgi:hypothetical protein